LKKACDEELASMIILILAKWRESCWKLSKSRRLFDKITAVKLLLNSCRRIKVEKNHEIKGLNTVLFAFKAESGESRVFPKNIF